MRKNTKPPGPGETRTILETKILGSYAVSRLENLGVPGELIMAAVAAKEQAVLDAAEQAIIKWFMEEEDLTEERAVHVLNGGRVIDPKLEAY